MRVVRLGNPQPVAHATGAHLDGDRVTEAHIPVGMSDDAAFLAITHRGEDSTGGWAKHSAADAPSWVWSDDPALAARLATHYGCPRAVLDDDGTPHQLAEGGQA